MKTNCNIMFLLALVILTVFQAALMASPTGIPGLYGTGVDDTGNPLPVNALEQHYILIGPSFPAFVTPQAGTPRLDKTWWPMDNSAPWIGPQLNINQDAPSGEYVYMITFDLTGLNLADLVISGQWSSDNGSSIYLNGVNTGFATPYVPYPDGPFAYVYNFTLNSGFVSGLNTLEFHVYNESGPTGLLVQNIVVEPGVNPIEAIVAFINTSINNGTLYPVKEGRAGEGQLNALVSMIWTAGNFVEANLLSDACEQLSAVLAKTDGVEAPDSAPDFVEGEAAPVLAGMIQLMMESLGCE